MAAPSHTQRVIVETKLMEYMRNHYLLALFLFALVHAPSSKALSLAFTGRTPDLPSTSKLEVAKGVMPGIPVLFDTSHPHRPILRPAHSDEHTTIETPVYRFEWQQDQSAMFYELYDPNLIEELSKSNAHDVASSAGKAYEEKIATSFFENGKLLQACVPSNFVGDITAYIVVGKNGNSEQVVVLPEGSVAQCILNSHHPTKFQPSASRFVAKAVIHIQGQDTKERKKEEDLQCYLPYAKSKDHMVMVMGCEVPGYHMRYDLAKENGAFMILLPDDADSLSVASHYFSIQTLSLNGGTLQALFDTDVKNIQKNTPGAKVVKHMTYKLPDTPGGSCIGAVMKYPKELMALTNETFYICDTGSKKYAILLSLGARTAKAMNEAHQAFIQWMNVPQQVKDMKIKFSD